MLKRIIPILLVDNNELIKTKSFKDPNYIGDLLNSVKIYNELQVDELCILDKSAKFNGVNYEMISEFVNESFSPVSYGGGIKNIKQIEKILRLGVEKVILNSVLMDYQFVKDAVSTYGSTTITACIDYRLESGKRMFYTENGIKQNSIEASELVKKISKLGVGEIIVQSIDRDGTYIGYDISFLEDLTKIVKNPIVIAGGCKNLKDIKSAFETGASGAACGSLFVYYTDLRGILINYPSNEEFDRIGIKR
jgi:imidazole glycerol-phosphate synthase subunit HisF